MLVSSFTFSTVISSNSKVLYAASTLERGARRVREHVYSELTCVCAVWNHGVKPSGNTRGGEIPWPRKHAPRHMCGGVDRVVCCVLRCRIAADVGARARCI